MQKSKASVQTNGGGALIDTTLMAPDGASDTSLTVSLVRIRKILESSVKYPESSPSVVRTAAVNFFVCLFSPYLPFRLVHFETGPISCACRIAPRHYTFQRLTYAGNRFWYGAASPGPASWSCPTGNKEV
ncbi:hypothetical protein KGM_212804 [Danaus plexippus plexippus]|uniref:Uncharacterized protein n=1 Tax=Danaus plexippus plexippus TaxID=278856 RepID=A0A212F6D8_DANPL|nr:hypothetical protein KGM_212804 [Danaus plexippus plexippus]